MNFIGDCIKFIIFIFFAFAFLGYWTSEPKAVVQVDEKKEVFMEDCMSVVMNTKKVCELIYNDLKRD